MRTNFQAILHVVQNQRRRRKKSLEWWLRDICRFCISCGNKKVEKKLIVVQIKKNKPNLIEKSRRFAIIDLWHTNYTMYI